MNPNNPYEGRWRWWYSAIADYMLANPGATHAAIAKALGRGTTTVSMIVVTDAFKTYYDMRKCEFQLRHNERLSAKISRVAEASLDLISAKLEKKGDQVPMEMLEQLATSSLDRLGFGPQKVPSIVVNQNVDQSRSNITVSITALEEARSALRMVEQQRAIQGRPSLNSTPDNETIGGALIDGALISEDSNLDPDQESTEPALDLVAAEVGFEPPSDSDAEPGPDATGPLAS